MRIHEIKCWTEGFEALLSGAKHHEVRRDDRAYCVGDVLRIREWERGGHAERVPDVHRPAPDEWWTRREDYTGRVLWMRITYKTPGGTWGVPADLCVLSVEKCDATEAEK